MAHRRSILFAQLGFVLTLMLAACQAQRIMTPQNQTTATANPSREKGSSTPKATATSQRPMETPDPDEWQYAPVFPESISNRAKEIYARGIELGRDPQVFSKVGDCGGTPSWFLGVFDPGHGEYRLGKYQNLEEVIAYFQGSFGRSSLAVENGFNAASILSTIRANPEFCRQGENPLACEFRLNNPSIALIMLGTNDVYHVDEFEGRLRQIIEYTIDQGILPVLASKPDNLEGEHSINRIIYSLSVEYEVPFWNVWLALQDLPDNGLQPDGAHVTFAPNYFDNDNAMQSGWPWRNLTALQVLDFLWQELEQ